jgi:hypothetical protein
MVGSGLTGSLRYALTNAADNDHITFGVTGTINLSGGLPGLAHSISIDGPGANLLTVRRNTGGDYGIFTVPYDGPTVSISGLTINNGDSVNGGYYFGGGGIFNGGTLTLANCTVNGNYAYDGVFAAGGGIFNEGTLTASNCTISGNQAGPIYPFTGVGGGIYNLGTLTLSNSTVAGNHAGIVGEFSYGGGIYNDGDTVTLNNSTVSGNFAFYGGGIFNHGDVGDGTVTLNNSTVSGNSGGGIANGKIILDGGTVTLNNSTVSGNSEFYQGISNAGGTLTLNNATVSGNTGGVNSYRGGTIHARNTIIANNMYSDLSGDLGSLGHNLIGNTNGGSGFDPTDLLNVDPLLGPLQDSGGPTQTQALLAGSPALNAGDPGQLGTADQRGVVRSGGVNIGAYQASATAFLVTAPNTVTSGVPFDVTVTAVDPFGQLALGNAGTVTFRTSDPDPNVVLPADYTFTASDQGAHIFSGGFTLITPGDQTITATDSADGLSASAVVTVQGGGAPAPRRPPVDVWADDAFMTGFDSNSIAGGLYPRTDFFAVC